MPQPPALTPEQRQQALAKAAEARRARAEIKEKLKMGSMTLSELLAGAGDNDHIGKMKVLAVIEALPGVGKVKARRTMEEIGIADTRRVPRPRRAAAQGAPRSLPLTRHGLLITISGLPGSGHHHRLPAGRRARSHLDRVPGGEVFRQLAAEAGMSLAEFGEHAQHHPEIDRELDDRLEARAREGSCVIESRLAGWLATRAELLAVRVWVDCDEAVRAGPGGRAGRHPAEQAQQDNAEREPPSSTPATRPSTTSTSTTAAPTTSSSTPPTPRHRPWPTRSSSRGPRLDVFRLSASHRSRHCRAR